MRQPPAPDRDPADGLFAPPTVSRRGATPLAVAGILCALAAVPTGLAILLGPAGMLLGALAHLKGARLGMPAAVLAGIATVVGMALFMFLG